MKKKIMMLLILLFVGVLAGCQQGMQQENTEEQEMNQVEIITNKGTIVVELNAEAAPQTVENFLSYVDEDFYAGTVFHRVIPNFMIQGGGFTQDATQKDTKPPIPIESDNGLKNTKGTIAMARTMDPNSATSQFFINTADNEFLNYGFRDEGYTVFGKVVEGMDVVAAIEAVPTAQAPMPDWPTETVVIQTIKRK